MATTDFIGSQPVSLGSRTDGSLAQCLEITNAGYIVRDVTSFDRRPESLLTIGLAHTLRMDVVAEGIEDATQLSELITLGCGRGQGFHLARPAPADDISLLLANNASTLGESGSE